MADAAFMQAQTPGQQATTHAHTAPGQGQAAIGNLSLLGQLGAKERHWKVKMILRAILCVLDIVAIGCSAWYAANGYGTGYYDYYGGAGSPYIAGPVLFAVSLIWCLCWINIPLVLRPPRPLHPGIAVGIDLVLWMAFAVIGWLFLVAVVDAAQDYGYYYYDSYYGSYYSSGGGSSTPRIATAGIADGLAWLNVLFHFMFFVWACVDTARYNRTKYMDSNKLVASQLVQSMEQRGLITVNDPAARQHFSAGWVGPPPQAYQQQYHQSQQYPPQQYQQQYQQPYQPIQQPQQSYQQPQQQPLQQQYSPQPNHSELSSVTSPQHSQYQPSEQPRATEKEKESDTPAIVPESQR